VINEYGKGRWWIVDFSLENRREVGFFLLISTVLTATEEGE